MWFLGNFYLALITDSNAVLALVRVARVIAHKLLLPHKRPCFPVLFRSRVNCMRAVCVRARPRLSDVGSGLGRERELHLQRDVLQRHKVPAHAIIHHGLGEAGGEAEVDEGG